MWQRTIFGAVTFGVLMAAVQTRAADSPSSPMQASSALAAPGQPGVVSMQPVESRGDASDLSADDRSLFSRAFAAADAGKWDVARTLAAQGTNPSAKDLITWRYLLDQNSGASFGEIDDFLHSHPDWPARSNLLVNAEKVMPEDMTAQAVLDWYGTREPATGYGEMRLGEALIATGKRSEGAERIRHAWINNPFSPSDETTILARHGDLLTADVQKSRLDRLLWSDDIGGARRQIPRVDSLTQRIAEARLTLKTNPQNAGSLLDSMSSSLDQQPGLLFDGARALRKLGKDEDAQPLIFRAPTQKADAGRLDRWWDERAVMARDALKLGQYQTAYKLVSDTGLTSGSDFADAQFMSGWLLLRFLNKPEESRKHFKALVENVSRPISLSRGYYWLGRADEAVNDKDAATTHYRQAAQYPETYYGQLALSRLEDKPVLHLAETKIDTRDTKASFEADKRVQAIRVLAALNQDGALRTFAITLAGDSGGQPARLLLLAELMKSLDRPSLALKVAKEASYQRVIMLSYLSPTMQLPKSPSATAPDAALVLGLMRQESEFDSKAVSSAGARGLMQLMPTSAQMTAKQYGLPYKSDALISDPQYNMQLGQAHFADFLNDWSGSYILAIASYNAGPNNVTKWIESYGDPRDPDIDPIDWVEEIPFSETRNYVQRVLENTQVYRNRLANADQPLQIMADLYRPNAPRLSKDTALIRPVPAPQTEPQKKDDQKDNRAALPASNLPGADLPVAALPAPALAANIPTPQPKSRVAQDAAPTANIPAPIRKPTRRHR
jgi:soluble lytic murein transglycosylase